MTRKKFFSMIIFCTIFFVAASTSADVQKFEHFSVDVPSGWNAEEKNTELTIQSQSTDVSITVSLNQTDEENLRDIAERFYLNFHGEDFEEDKDGDYTFNFTNESGDESVALITGNENYYLVFSITGFDDENAEKDVQKILDSIDWYDNKNK